jgi:aerobic-type carbon monoxide dehydrogenase small subunit (CoxS/CutS family)
MSEETKKTPRAISRRDFLRDAGIVVGGTAVGSAFFLTACGKEVEVTKTVTTTAPGTTKTVTTTAADNTVTVTKYTCPICSQEFDTLEALKAHFDSVHEQGAVAPKKPIEITVNGRKHEMFVQANWSLHDVIKKQLRLTGAKTFCKRGACGSCTVIMNGRPILSCITLAIECDGKNIETSEGIASDEHPLIDAYVNNECAQCGYCTPGFVVTAKALLDRNPNPTEDEAREALAGNLCRCGTYPQHSIAVLEAAKVLRGGV